MNYVFSFLLGIIQGFTEFLPISSSGHLQIINHFFDFLNKNEDNFFLTIVLHFATCLSTIVIFKKKIGHIFLTRQSLKKIVLTLFYILYLFR